ncbi:class II fructose-bisphosphate aldolase [Candidatus Microgenomates bacterium]|nr:class II fructose-bisphosphate aldolase [Candidatus Microgenomates bacterium]
MEHKNVNELLNDLQGIIEIKDSVKILDQTKLRDQLVDKLAFDAVFGSLEVMVKARFLLWDLGQNLSIIPTSNHDLYVARGVNKYSGKTMPSINVRAMTYFTARATLKAAVKNNVGMVQFELARSEIGYTNQRPAEYSVVLIAAAIKEGFQGPLFIQADHFQVKAQKYLEDPEREASAIKKLIKEAVDGGWFSFELDLSTLVDLKKNSLEEQQRLNYELSAQLTQYARSLEQDNITLGLGAEIGEVGEKNSTPEELNAFMKGYSKTLQELDANLEGLCKISIQTGTSHGGVVLPDGTLAQVKVDFETLGILSQMARDEFGMGGAVQHGASTLPDNAFALFPEKETCEIHLATGFQNILYDHEKFPPELKKKMYQYLDKNHLDERKDGQTDDQFYYKLRKKALGPFKKELWYLDHDCKNAIMDDLEKKFTFLFKQLNVFHTQDLVNQLVKPIKVKKSEEDFKKYLQAEKENIKGLAD